MLQSQNVSADPANDTGNESTAQNEPRADDEAPGGAGVSSIDLIQGAAQALDGFDPARHATNPDGTPALTVTGSFRKKPGRKPGQKTAAQSEAANEPNSTPAPAKLTPAQNRAVRVSSDETSKMLLNFFVGGMAAMVGPEWDFQDEQEATSLKAALSAYIEAKGHGKMSPEAMLLLCVGSYALPRLAVPNTRDKLGGFFGKIWSSAKSGLQAIFRR